MNAVPLEHLSISDRLSRLGYEHRKFGDHPFARCVVHTQSGRVIGLLSACEAAVFCWQVEAGATEAEAVDDIQSKARNALPVKESTDDL